MSPNRLAEETSPYLQQHKDNPVDWWAWGPDALAAAQAQDKPILLSVGYAACHWCHVMAHESFENAEIAGLMNERFINIKVDREERPDLDSLYQTALALTGQQGGWPLTMFLTPDGAPFWGGTYFPPSPAFGRPGFPQVLEQVAKIYHDRPDVVTGNRQKLQAAMGQLYKAGGTAGGEVIDPDMVPRAARHLAAQFDPVNGGTKGAPKFPQAPLLGLLWRGYCRTGDAACRDAFLLAMERMSNGGIYDHLGGGYARYSVDERWLVPHFEKMLYDNGQLLSLLLEAWRITGDPLFKSRIYETVQWLMRDMRQEGGAFAASLDADSEGEEGKYYVWSEGEINAALGDAATLFKRVHDVQTAGNWEGKTILNRLALPHPLTDKQEATLADARTKLLALRQERVPPGLDDKVLADWNALVIAPLAEASQLFGEPAWLEAAEGAFAFITAHMTRGDKSERLYHSYRDGRVLETDLADDYANMAAAALALFDVTQNAHYLERAKAWVDTARRHFEDTEGGGFYLSADDAADVFLRVRTGIDHAVPNANGVMAQVLVKIYHLTLDETYRTAAERTIAGFEAGLKEQPLGLPGLLAGLDDLLNAPQIVLVTGGEDVTTWKEAIFRASLPGRSLRVVEGLAELDETHPARAAELSATPAVLICRGQSCSLPVTTLKDLKQALTLIPGAA